MESDWTHEVQLPFPMNYGMLKSIEESGINDMIPYYMNISEDGRDVGRANLYIVDSDLSSLDTTLPKQASQVIKKWFPDFMQFKTLECGYLSNLGEGLILNPGYKVKNVLPDILPVMDELSRGNDVDIQIFRDIKWDHYREYLETLRSFGFYPALGFSNTRLILRWKTFDEYLDDLTTKKRYLYKNVLNLKEKFEIEMEICKDFGQYSRVLSELWENVYCNAKEYTREKLNENYFRLMSSNLSDHVEIFIYRWKGKIIAFALCTYSDDEYSMLNWGADFNFPHFYDSNLGRINMLLGMKRAIELGKKKYEIGITNYMVKLELGAHLEPMVYFLKHMKKPKFSRTVADMVTESIKQPISHKPFKINEYNDNINIEKIKIQVRNDCTISDNDIFSKIENFEKVKKVKLAGLYGLYPEFGSAQASSILIKGKKTILLGTNSYLGISNDPEVLEEIRKTIDKYGSGCSGSPLMNGTLDIHNRLEADLAAFFGREAVVLFSTGYQTNLAGISTLASPGDMVILDERSHRSLFDGVKLSGADYLVYRHNNLVSLEKLLSRNEDRKKLIVTDSVFSMEGIIPDLIGICDLAQKYKSRLFVDEAHAVGIFGANGRGVCEMLGIEARVDMIMTTFSKSFGSIGGCIAGKKDIIEYIKHNASGHIFSASLPPSAIATVSAVLRIIRERPEMRKEILNKAEFMGNALHEMGYNARYLGTQIVPVIFGNYLFSLAAYRKFLENGVYVNPVGPPAVPENAAGFRTSYMAGHRWEDLEFALGVFREIKQDLIFN